ncbi:hypothetical protein evm_013576 [Chilo suppressalis]|nr:hypothetical protein evm_013576 [Chilo suppressalis]
MHHNRPAPMAWLLLPRMPRAPAETTRVIFYRGFLPRSPHPPKKMAALGPALRTGLRAPPEQRTAFRLRGHLVTPHRRSQSAAPTQHLSPPVIQDNPIYLDIVNETLDLPASPSPQPQPSTSSQAQAPSRPRVLAALSSQGGLPVPLSPPITPASTGPTTPPRRRRPSTPGASATPPTDGHRPRFRSPAIPQSNTSTGRPRLRARRRRAPTAFERAASEFAAVKLRRLELEETRTRLQHERDLRALEVEHDRNQVFRELINVAQAWLDYFRCRDNTERLNTE